MAYNITFKDWLIRTCLDAQMNLRYINNTTTKGVFKVTTDYKLVFSDSFSDRANWDSGSEFGIPPYHPGYLLQWYDNDQIRDGKEGMELWSVVKPQYFQEINTTIPNAIGYMRTKSSWKYGIFNFTAKLPSGKYLWPALWLSGLYNWPPEIDVLEAYSEKTTDYYSGKKLQSNVHFGNQDNAGARTHRLPNNVIGEFIDYTLWWEADFIKIYYNGYLVRHITDRVVLDGMFEAQKIIIGNGVQEGFNQNNLTPLVIKSVKVFQK